MNFDIFWRSSILISCNSYFIGNLAYLIFKNSSQISTQIFNKLLIIILMFVFLIESLSVCFYNKYLYNKSFVVFIFLEVSDNVSKFLQYTSSQKINYSVHCYNFFGTPAPTKFIIQYTVTISPVHLLLENRLFSTLLQFLWYTCSQTINYSVHCYNFSSTPPPRKQIIQYTVTISPVHLLLENKLFSTLLQFFRYTSSQKVDYSVHSYNFRYTCSQKIDYSVHCYNFFGTPPPTKQIIQYNVTISPVHLLLENRLFSTLLQFLQYTSSWKIDYLVYCTVTISPVHLLLENRLFSTLLQFLRYTCSQTINYSDSVTISPVHLLLENILFSTLLQFLK